MMGEGYHNNHHNHCNNPNFGVVRWHEIDITYKIMQFLNFIGIIEFKPYLKVKNQFKSTNFMT